MEEKNSVLEASVKILLSILLAVLILFLLVAMLFLLRENRELKEQKKTLEQEYKKKEAEIKAEKKEEKATQEREKVMEEKDKTVKRGKMPEGTDEVDYEEILSDSVDGIGKQEPIPEEIREQMQGISMPEGTTKMTFDDLAYLTLPHYDFWGNVVDGHMVVNKDVAEDVIQIFKDLYDIQYPIQRMELIDKFDSHITDRFDTLDRSSMGRNNTSCFCYRVVSGSDRMSNHAWGRAIDVNPLINPWVQEGGFSPKNAGAYVDRGKKFEDELLNRATIHADDEVVQIFEKYGWSWGGYWENQKDYQHFEKK